MCRLLMALDHQLRLIFNHRLHRRLYLTGVNYNFYVSLVIFPSYKIQHSGHGSQYLAVAGYADDFSFGFIFSKFAVGGKGAQFFNYQRG